MVIIVVLVKIVFVLIDEIGLFIKGVVVILVGFFEVGNEELEREFVKKVRKYGVRLIGLNCVGIFGVYGKFFGFFEVCVKFGGLVLIS